jgi:hypothetical protein
VLLLLSFNSAAVSASLIQRHDLGDFVLSQYLLWEKAVKKA